jgi:hypothetical protein
MPVRHVPRPMLHIGLFATDAETSTAESSYNSATGRGCLIVRQEDRYEQDFVLTAGAFTLVSASALLMTRRQRVSRLSKPR